MAAGTASRFAPLSYEKPKALFEVKGEVLIERQIRQLLEAGIEEIIVVVGYKKEQFEYLKERFGVKLVENKAYLTRNNNSSIYVVKDYLRNSYICSSDNYFTKNPFGVEVDESYYAAVYAEGETAEWCMEEDEEGYIKGVTIGGRHSWYMLGHTFWSEEFSKKFVTILEKEYDLPETAPLLWERIFMNHLSELKMKIRKYPDDIIYEFDTLDELRTFDATYIYDTRSEILKSIVSELGCKERDIVAVVLKRSENNMAVGFRFRVKEECFEFDYMSKELKRG